MDHDLPSMRRLFQKTISPQSIIERENLAYNGTDLMVRQGPWKNRDTVELATLKWVDWFNNRRLLSSIGNIPPAEAEARFYAQQKSHALAT